MHRFNTFLFTLLVGTFLPVAAFAAGLDLVKIVTTPDTPGPNQEITVTVQSYAVNLNTAEIIWYVNKEPVLEGIAKKSITVRTGDFGEVTTINVLINPAYGEPINRVFTIEPSEVDILWEADTYTPPFYKGKALPSFKSKVTLTAIPRKNSAAGRPEAFYYKWTYNRIEGLGEALGMNSVFIRSGWPDSSIPVKVDVSMLNTEWKGTKTIQVPTLEPTIVFYEKDPLLGTLFHKGVLHDATGKGNSFSLLAVPYFFSNDNLVNNELIYTWVVNNTNVATPLEPTNLELTKTGQAAEAYAVDLRIQNPKRILQEARASTQISLPTEE